MRNEYDFLNNFFTTSTYKGYNPVNVETKDDTSIITIDIPGYKKEDIKIDADEKYLNINLEGKRGSKNYRFKLNEADILNISSSLELGELVIKVPSKKTNKVNIEIR